MTLNSNYKEEDDDPQFRFHTYIVIVEPCRPSTKEAGDDLHNIPYPISKV